MVFFNSVKAMVLVLRRNPKCKVEKLKYKKLKGMHPDIKNKSEVLPSRLINTVYHNKGGGGLKREGGLINFLPLKNGEGSVLERGGLFERGGGGLIEDLRYVCCSFLPLLTPGTLRKIQIRGFSIQIPNFKRVDKEPILCFAKSLLWGSNVYSNWCIDIKSYFLLTLYYLT